MIFYQNINRQVPRYIKYIIFDVNMHVSFNFSLLVTYEVNLTTYPAPIIQPRDGARAYVGFVCEGGQNFKFVHFTQLAARALSTSYIASSSSSLFFSSTSLPSLVLETFQRRRDNLANFSWKVICAVFNEPRRRGSQHRGTFRPCICLSLYLTSS